MFFAKRFPAIKCQLPIPFKNPFWKNSKFIRIFKGAWYGRSLEGCVVWFVYSGFFLHSRIFWTKNWYMLETFWARNYYMIIPPKQSFGRMVGQKKCYHFIGCTCFRSQDICTIFKKFVNKVSDQKFNSRPNPSTSEMLGVLQGNLIKLTNNLFKGCQ